MKTYLFYLFICLPTFVQATSQDTLKFWQNKPWAEVLALAKHEQKMIFVDVYTTWCGPCMKMNKTVFKDVAVVQYMNENFINVKIDAEKGEGKEIAQKYQVGCYPTFLFVHQEGDLLSAFCNGFLSNEEFLAEVKKRKEDAFKIRGMLQNAGSQVDNATIVQQLKALDLAGVSTESLFETYWKQRTANTPLSKEEITLIKELASNYRREIDYHSTLFKIYFDNYDALAKEFSIENKLYKHPKRPFNSEEKINALPTASISSGILRSNIHKYRHDKNSKEMQDLMNLYKKYDYYYNKYKNKPKRIAKINNRLYSDKH